MDIDIEFIQCEKCKNDIDECICRFKKYNIETQIKQQQDDCCGNGCSGCERWKK